MSARILLVDDHASNIATLEAVLDSPDYELHTALDGPSACEAAERLRPDLILLDVMMPGMDGFEVCRRIRALDTIRAVPVVMLTALNDRASRIAGIQAGADDFVSKPFSVEELRARVRTITRLNRARVMGEQRARFEHLFDLAPSAILVLRADCTVVSANRRARARFGGAESAPATGGPPISPPADVLPELRRLLSSVFAPDPAAPSAPAPADCHIRSRGPSGVRVWQVSAVRLDERPAPLALVAFEDVSSEVLAREDAENLNRRLDGLVRERTARLEEANQLLNSYAVFVAHDLRSPLSAVQGFLSLATATARGVPAETLDYVRQANGAAHMIEEMIADTLALAAREHSDGPTAKPIDPKPVIDRLCGKLRSLHPTPRPRFLVHPLPPVLASGALIDRIFFNLVSNSLKYSASRPEPFVEIGPLDTPDGPAIYVRDNGVGFSPEEADGLFREFSRLSTSAGHDGLGVGLSLVARLVRAHHGRIWAEGRPGEGATFFVLLPGAPPSPTVAL